MKLQIPVFAEKAELFNYLVKNKADLIDLKKSEIKHADAFGMHLVVGGLPIIKAAKSEDDTDFEIKRTLIGNTYNWMDSHDDVHLDNVFGVSIKQRQDRIRHLHDHIYQLMAKVGKPSSVYEKAVKWADLGVNKLGSTMALFMDSTIKKALNSNIFEAYKDGEIDQHSVGMQYVKIDLAINNPDNKEEFSVWNKYINLLGNKEKAEEKGYFWAVKEAKLIEISCVMEGSNELTPTLDPLKDSQIKIDPPAGSHKSIYSLLAN